MERLEDLNLNGLKIYQDDGLYTFTSDSVLLTRFANVKKGDVVADFCSGSGIVGLHLYALNAEKIDITHYIQVSNVLRTKKMVYNKKKFQLENKK